MGRLIDTWCYCDGIFRPETHGEVLLRRNNFCDFSD